MSYFQRPTTRYPLPSGTIATLQPLSELEWEEVARLCRREDGSFSNALAKAHTVMFGLVSPKPQSLDDVHNMPSEDRDAADLEISYLSGVLDRPEPPSPEGDEGKEAEADPLVEEFPDAGVDSVEAVDGDPVGMPGVSLPAGPVAGADTGDVPDDLGGREGASGTQPPGAN